MTESCHRTDGTQSSLPLIASVRRYLSNNMF
jgi:hypothetical protein